MTAMPLLKPFELPGGFGDDFDGEPSVECVAVDPREHALDCLADYADMLYGDIVLVPFVDGSPDWPNTTRDTLEKFSGHWTELEPEDVPRLGILTDSFDKFLGAGNEDVSVVTLLRDGTPLVEQIAGRRSVLAVDIITNALIDDEPLKLRKPTKPKEPLKAANDNTFQVVNPAHWEGLPVPRREWFAPDLIPMRQVTILNGDGGAGKSLVSLQVCAASALSVDTLGMEPLAGRVLYLGAEDEADEFHRRLADIVQHHGMSMSDLFRFRLLPMADMDALLSVPSKSGVMEPTPLWLGVAEYAREFQPGLIVLDTAADLFGGDEIKRSQVRQFIGMLRKLAMEINCAIVLLAHPSVDGMRSGTGSSGSTAWNNSVRSRLYLTTATGDGADPDVRILTTMKANYGKKGGELRMRWQDGVFVLDDGKSPAVTGMLNKRHDDTFMKVLGKLVEQGINVSANTGPTYAPSKISTHPEGKGSSKRQLGDAMARLLDAGKIKMVTEGSASRMRSRLIVC